MKDSKIMEQIYRLIEQRNKKIKQVHESYHSEISKIKQICQHQWDDGSSAIMRCGSDFNGYCYICGKVVK